MLTSMVTSVPLYDSFDFTLGVSSCAVDGPRAATSAVESSFTVIFPQSGLFVRTVANEATVASPAVALLVNPAEEAAIAHPCGGGDRSVFLSVSESRAGPHVDDSGFPASWAHTSAVLDLLVRTAAIKARRGELTALDVDEMFVAVCQWSAERHEVITPQQERALALAEEFLATGDGRDADLVAIGRHVGYSPHHLSRLYRKARGTTLGSYRSRVRLRAAIAQLLEGDDDIAAVAAACGFFDHSHLSRQMKRSLGMTPRQVRARRG